MGKTDMGMTYTSNAPKSVLDFIIGDATFTSENCLSRPIMVASLDDETFFVAVQNRDQTGQTLFVYMVIYDIDMQPDPARGLEGMAFGYRRIHEAEGPFRYGCPASLMNELTDTTELHALDWREGNEHFISSKDGRALVREVVITDLRDSEPSNSLRM